MKRADDHRTIFLHDEWGDGPLWVREGPDPWWGYTQPRDGSDLLLSRELDVRLIRWHASAQVSFDEVTCEVGEVPPEVLEEGAKIAQLVADEMGVDVPVRFEQRTYRSFAPPTNPRARRAFEDYLSERWPGVSDWVRDLWWAADWPPPPPPLDRWP